MNPLGLSAEAIERRRNYLTASDAAKIMAGSWPEVYRLKKGLAEEDNLDDELRVQMGSFTEPFGLWWYEKMTGRSVEYFSDNPVAKAAWYQMTARPALGEFVASSEHPFMACSLDATSTTSKGHPCVLDAKHIGTFRYDDLVQRYLPGMTHQAVVCDVDHWALSVFVGNGRWELIEQEVDPFYREELIEKEAEFWSWIERDEEPPFMDEAREPPPPQPRRRNIAMPAMGTPDWQTFIARNNWAVDAANAIHQFAETEGAAKAHAISREEIKKLTPEDCGALAHKTGHGLFLLKRSTSGALTMKLEKGND